MSEWIRTTGGFGALVAVCLAAATFALPLWGQPQGKSAPPPPKPSPAARVALDQGVSVGAAARFDNLAVLPVYSKKQEQIGEFTTLPLALKYGQAEVREESDGGQVSVVVVANRGEKPIFVLAGTLIKGGKQDRLIGQDFLIGARKTVKVDAFCVEQGRWTKTRSGRQTGGKFTASGTVAGRKVRAAGQFETNQGKVWAEVAKVNQAHQKSTSTGTLMATMDDEQLATRRKALAVKAAAHLRSQPDRAEIVGFAYAVDGKVRGVRWFMNHQLFDLYADALIETAALEALTAQAEATSKGKPVARLSASPRAVVKFIAARKRAKRTVSKKTSGGNVNEYQFSDDGYRSKVRYRPKPSAPPKTLSAEYF
ncbi:MAG: hypothetical protein JRI23_02125 [Deltaproteobacteria bacterium]|jgi:hypothetical protein|nr:hypothetical protein [Deltaproteobacteria bacterium]MBW2530276.1 hypothetical protein [Deltaproteobacteria bacterium]